MASTILSIIALLLIGYSFYDRKDKTSALFLISTICIVVHLINWALFYYSKSIFIFDHFAYKYGSYDKNIYSCITYAFLHSSFAHIISNLFTVLLFYPILKKVDNFTIWKVFILGALCGVIFSVFFKYIYMTYGVRFGEDVYIVGASAGIVALMGFCIFNYQNSDIKVLIFNTKVSYLVIYFIIIYLLSIIFFNNILGNYAHLGGLFCAWALHKTNRDVHTIKKD